MKYLGIMAILLVGFVGTANAEIVDLKLVTVNPGTNISVTIPGLGNNISAKTGEYNVEISGNAAWNGTYAGFCVDAAPSLYAFSAYDIVPVQNDGSAYEKAAWVFSQYGSDVTGSFNPDTAKAAQLAIWELSFDTDGNIYTGAFKANSTSGAADLAQQFVNAANSADLTAFNTAGFYLAKSPAVIGNDQTDYQDYMIYKPVPEPSLIFLLGAGLLGIAINNKRKQK